MNNLKIVLRLQIEIDAGVLESLLACNRLLPLVDPVGDDRTVFQRLITLFCVKELREFSRKSGGNRPINSYLNGLVNVIDVKEEV